MSEIDLQGFGGGGAKRAIRAAVMQQSDERCAETNCVRGAQDAERQEESEERAAALSAKDEDEYEKRKVNRGEVFAEERREHQKRTSEPGWPLPAFGLLPGADEHPEAEGEKEQRADVTSGDARNEDRRAEECEDKRRSQSDARRK